MNGFENNLAIPSYTQSVRGGYTDVWWVYGFTGVLLYGYECMVWVMYVTPLPAHRAPALHTTQPLTRAKRAAMQTRRMCTLTEPLTAQIRTSGSLWSSGPTPLSSRACTCCVEACVHISERKLGQSMSKDAAINRRTDDF